MIVGIRHGKGASDPYRYVVFAVSTEHGTADSDFREPFIVRRDWSQIRQLKMGEIIWRETEQGELFGEKKIKDYYAIVCFECKPDGWQNTPQTVQDCLDRLQVSDEEEVAVEFMGTGLESRNCQPDVFAIMDAIARSKKRIILCFP